MENFNQKRKINIIDVFLFLLFVILTIFLIINIVELSNIENFLRYIVVIILVLVFALMIIFYKHRKLLCRVVMILLFFLYGFLNNTFYRVYSSIDNMTTKVDTKVICLVTSLENVVDIDSMTEGEIGIINESMDLVANEFAIDVLESEGLNNSLVQYSDYLQIIDDLINKKIDYAFLPENYNDIYNYDSGEEKKELNFNVLYRQEKYIRNNEVANLKDVNEPFTLLLMGSDVLLDSYNADTLMLLTVNPKTMKVTMLSIPRDTYTVIACTGGKHKINSSGWYGDSCVVKTVEKYLDVDIDYYAKINFLGIVDLVDKLGGIEVDVPYAFCEQNSNREFGSNIVYVDSGLQTLSGEQALALSRNRHYWQGTCPSKYTTDGDRNDITRGQNQQLVIKAILNKMMSVRDINTFYDILDTVGNNMVTNMSKDTIFSFYNVGKVVIKRLGSDSVSEVINIDRLSLKSHSANILISGLELSMLVNYKESIDYVSKEMKKNLGFIKEEDIKTFSFDINDEYNENNVSYNRLTSNLSLLPNFFGKTVDETLNYCDNNGLQCEIETGVTSGIIETQSIGANTDISTIWGKVIIFGVKNENKIDNVDDIEKSTNEDSIKQDIINQDIEKSEIENDDVETPSIDDNVLDERDGGNE